MRAANFGIYVHWPFCTAKCPYCDFNSHVRVERDEAAWQRAIARELEFVVKELAASHRSVTSVFFGGGTPSLVSGRAVGTILDKIATLWSLADSAEITLEANPTSADAARFRDYRSAGVNRLSLGVQSLDDKALAFLGRRHSATEARAAAGLATTVFERVSLDMIYSRPEQSIAEWRSELAEAIALGTEHLSLYQLTIEDSTPFAALERAGVLLPNGEDCATELYEVTQETMEAAGLPAYEISNHATPGRECRHNLLYWRYGSFAGVGPGAHGRIANGGEPIATSGERLPERWLAQVAEKGHGFSTIDQVSEADAAREHLVMNLRLAEGLDLGAYRARWNRVFDETVMEDLELGGFLLRRGARVFATPTGRLVLNTVLAALADASRPVTSPELGMSLAPG
ncbi:MAG TPA: radical SAM family heme chaperone HemW [Rhizomicrobium sp.]|jgi:oxygen-independent coproporphyrinogen-3 oxidase